MDIPQEGYHVRAPSHSLSRTADACPQLLPFPLSSTHFPPHQEIKFADSGSYKGYFKNGMPEGFGESRDPSGNTYSGDFHEVRLGDLDR